MKKTLLVLTALLLSCVLTSSAQTEERKLTKKEKKMLQQKLDSLAYDEALRAILDSTFTLETSYILTRAGVRVDVTPRTNFISINKGKATVQLAFPGPSSGYNGMGGITVDGMVTQYETSMSKKGKLTAVIDILGAEVSARLHLTLIKGSNGAMAKLKPSFNSFVLTFEGNVYPLEKSAVIKGTIL
ncbi:MAG: DUF4251 domain-containing protein [Prevotellaceae bacterium]|nr:DUF4251 domain-containing protein [Prevotellaceae bacterium]